MTTGNLLFQIWRQWLIAEAFFYVVFVQIQSVVDAVDWQRVVPQVNGKLSFPVQILTHVDLMHLGRGRSEANVAGHEHEQLETVRVEVLVSLLRETK